MRSGGRTINTLRSGVSRSQFIHIKGFFFLFSFLHSLVKTELCCMIFNVDYYDKECFSILRFL